MDKPKSEPPKTDQIKTANKEIKEVLAKHEMELVPELSFPRYNQLPDEVQLALAVIMKHEPSFVVALRPRKQD